MDKPRTFKPRGSFSDSSEGLLYRGKGEARIYKSFSTKTRFLQARFYWSKDYYLLKKTSHLKLMNLYFSTCSCCCCCQVASVMSDSVLPHRQQPTRLPHPWDSLGKNTGVGCHFLLQCMKVKSESEVAYRKIKESGFTEIIPLIYTSAI